MKWLRLLAGIPASIVLFAVPQQDALATLRGVVTEARTGAPAPNVSVGLQHGRRTRSVRTDPFGRFTFSDVPPGTIQLGLLSEISSAGVFRGRRAYMTVEPRQQIEDLNILVTEDGIVTGRILTPDGAPAVGAVVQVARRGYEFGGRCTFEPVAQDRTDDRGLYRIFGLPSGEYYVRAGTSSSLSQYTFFPGTRDPSAAQRVVVVDGEQTDRIDFALSKLVFMTVSGTIDLEKPPPVPVSFGIDMQRTDQCAVGLGATPSTASFNATIPATSGTFELIVSVAPTSQEADWLRQRMMTLVSRWQGSDRLYAGRTTIQLSGQDLSGIRINVQPLMPLSGRIQVHPDSDPISLQSIQLAVFPSTRSYVEQPVTADGTFIMPTQFVGRHYVLLENLSAGAYVVDIRSDGASVYGEGIVIAGTTPEPLEVILDSGGGVVEGRVLDSENRPAVFVAAVLVPTEAGSNPLYYKTAGTDRNGMFRFHGVAPGDYRVLAWKNVPEFAWQNGDFLARFKEYGTATHVERQGRSSGLTVHELIP